jgi:hypothetical protein
MATGAMDEKAARANAQFVRDPYVTTAARMNMTAGAASSSRFPYRVQGEGMAAPLEQAVSPAPSDRVSELLPLSNMLDERGFARDYASGGWRWLPAVRRN